MRKHFQILFFVVLVFMLIPAVNYSQENDYLEHREHPSVTGVFISGGIDATKYYSDNFIQYLYDKTHSAISAPAPFLSIKEGSVNPAGFVYSNPSTYPIVNIGLQINSSKLKNVNHIIEASFMQYKGNYSYNFFCHWTHGTATSDYYMYDTIQTQFTQKIISLGYKFQPTYKCVFISVGLNASVSLIKANIQKQEQIDIWTYHETIFKWVKESSTSNTSCTSSNLFFVNVPFEIGGGGYIKIKKIVLKPGFYFTPCFLKGYNFYTVSLGILHINNKNKKL